MGSPFYTGDEAIAPPRNCLDVPMLASSFLERLSQHRDRHFQISFFNKTVGPHKVNQFFFLDHPLTVLNQKQQNVKRFRS
jgi:hypothetical protein